MSTEANRALVLQFVEALNRHDLPAFDELLAADILEHEEGPYPLAPGREGVKQAFAMLFNGLPDLRLNVEDIILGDDKAVLRSIMTGTHNGELFGLPASGKAVRFPVIDIVRLANGQIVEHWAVSDNLALMQQIGAIPAPEGL